MSGGDRGWGREESVEELSRRSSAAVLANVGPVSKELRIGDPGGRRNIKVVVALKEPAWDTIRLWVVSMGNAGGGSEHLPFRD